MKDPAIAVVVPAAGSGRRMGGVQKQFLELAGEPVLLRAMRPFLEHPSVRWVVVALLAADAAAPPEWLRELDPRIAIVAGGTDRSESVRRALERVPDEADVVMIHDGARPLITRAVIDRTLAGVTDGQGAIAALPMTDTVKRVGADGFIADTLERGELWRAQTPQAFPRALLVDAYRAAATAGAPGGAADGVAPTDDAAVVERNGGRVVVVEGDPENLKVTEPADILLATALLARREAR